MNDPKFDEFKIVHWCSPNYDKRSNAAFLACCYLVLNKKIAPKEATSKFENVYPPLTPFRDANMGDCK